MNTKAQSIIIRALNPDDAVAFRALRLQGLREEPIAFLVTPEEEEHRTVTEIAERLAPNPDTWVLGAFLEERLVGCVGFYREVQQRVRHKGKVWGTYIAPDARGNGYGRRLMEALIGKAGTIKGIEQITLYVVTTNTTARKLYQSLGFVSFGLELHSMKTENGYTDEELMVLLLNSTD